VPLLAGSRLAPAWVRACALAGALRRAGSAGTVARFFFPSRAFMVRRYDVPEDARWWPLLWLWRPIAAALRVLAGS
jgi:hypothetical protein